MPVLSVPRSQRGRKLRVAAPACAARVQVPLLDTGAGGATRVVRPPGASARGAVCAAWPDDVQVVQGLNPFRNGSLYKATSPRAHTCASVFCFLRGGLL